MKLLVTGTFGLIGTRFLELNNGRFEIVALDRNDAPSEFENTSLVKADITDSQAIEKAILEAHPAAVLHMAAYTDVNGAESNKKLAWNINVEGTKNIAKAAKKVGAKVIFLSTDHTFKGNSKSYQENDQQEPINYYGQTKYEAEQALMKNGLNYLIIRLSYPYRARFEAKSDTVRWMIPKLQNGETLTLVNDQYISPTFADDLIEVIFRLIEKGSTGVFHVAGHDCLTFYEMGQKVCEVFGFEKSLVQPISLEEFTARTNRVARQPKLSCLNVEKAEKEISFTMSDFEAGLRKIKEQLDNSNGGLK
ncbi:MAG: NAD(P)-dependent oxidoreductase [Patescibacteria group bacterium]|nr:NAD(P)-dependent oxidoreductase [Patescibacteria group bacterium]